MATENKFVRALGITAIWLVTVLVALVFGTQGWSKFFSNSFWAVAFEHWGYPVWFRLLIGVAECAVAVLILVPRLAAYGASLAIAIMLGGIVTKVRAGDVRQIKAEIVWIVMAGIVLVVRRRAAARLAANTQA